MRSQCEGYRLQWQIHKELSAKSAALQGFLSLVTLVLWPENSPQKALINQLHATC